MEINSLCLSDSGGICGPQPTLANPCVGPSPIDHIFQFHKALMRDFKLFEADAGELVQLLERGETKWEKAIQDLTGKFRFLRGIYIAHSSTEDNVVFPALESKDALKNISHSYMLDHKEEGELFDDMEKVCELYNVGDLWHIEKLQEIRSVCEHEVTITNIHHVTVEIS